MGRTEGVAVGAVGTAVDGKDSGVMLTLLKFGRFEDPTVDGEVVEGGESEGVGLDRPDFGAPGGVEVGEGVALFAVEVKAVDFGGWASSCRVHTRCCAERLKLVIWQGPRVIWTSIFPSGETR